MTGFVQEGKALTLTAPYDRTAGQLALVGALVVVALNDVDQDAEGEFATEGVWEVDKVDAQAWTQGARIFFDSATKLATTVASGNTLIGIAVEAADNPSDTGIVRLNGAVDEVFAGGAAETLDSLTEDGDVIGGTNDGDLPDLTDTVGAALTFGTNITAATANGALADSSATNPTEGEFNELAKELGTKINALIADNVALRAAVREAAAKVNDVVAVLEAHGLSAPTA